MSDYVSRLGGFMFMLPRDIGLFLRSARTDASLEALRTQLGNAAAFDEVYRGGDPWASSDPRFRYQHHKYDVIESLIPRRHFASALDLGCGSGLLTRRLAKCADAVLGLDISAAAVAQARQVHEAYPSVRFAMGDISNLPAFIDGAFDLLVITDSLYYLPPPLDDAALRPIAARMGSLLQPGGVCVLANHFFFGLDSASRLSRRIHRAFATSPAFRVKSEHRRPFYLVSVLEKQ
jgi:SAM-dependent methyltransferase